MEWNVGVAFTHARELTSTSVPAVRGSPLGKES